MMGWYNNGWGLGASAGLGMLVMFAFWAAIIALAIWAIARVTRSNAAPSAESPRAILDRRFASGEIDAEAYAQARRILESATGPGH